MTVLRCLLLIATVTLLACSKKAPDSTPPPAAAPAPAGAPAPTPPAAAAPAPPAAAAPGAEPAPASSDAVDEKLAKAQKALAKVQKGLALAQQLKALVWDSVDRNRGIPPSFDDVRARNVQPSDSDVESIDLANSGSIILKYAPDADFPGGTIELKPVVTDNKVSSWSCSGGT